MDAFTWILSVFTQAWQYLGTYNFRGVPISLYVASILILGIMFRRIFG